MDDFQSQAVKRMLTYIEDHLSAPVSMKQLADAAGYSIWHAQHLFSKATGCSVFSYLRSRRLALAAHEMGQGERRIIDVAFDFMFDSHEGFTRAFTRQFGMSPSEYRKAMASFRQETSPHPKNTSEESMQTVFVQVVDRPKRKAIVKFSHHASDYYEYCEEVGCDVWETLGSIEGAIFEPIGMWMPPNLRKLGAGIYSQGVEVPLDYEGIVPKGFDIITLEECRMMVFQGPPYDDNRFEEAISDIWQVMKTYDPTLYGFRWDDEAGPRYQLSPMGYRGYIEARPVQELNRD